MAGNYDFRHDSVLNWVGPLASGAVTAPMDEFGKQLFGLWLSGTAPKDVTFDDPKWAAYMAANQSLSAQIDKHLIEFAEFYRDFHAPMTPARHPQLQKRNPAQRCGPAMAPMNVPHQRYHTRFHAEIGGPDGSYFTGYDQLHGSDRNARFPDGSGGDFEIEGMMHVTQLGSKIEFTFRNNQMTFNDKVNPNAKYNMDVLLATFARNMKASLGGPPPKEYNVHIRWREPGPWTYTIPAVQ